MAGGREDRSRAERRVDVGDVTLTWGDATRWKARLRDESTQRHVDLPIGERLRAALSMVIPRRDR
jgi:hypothetical protein